MNRPSPLIPTIAPLALSADRPFWSVVVPARNPQPRFLFAALDSVLEQDPGTSQMQIEVLDDFSDSIDVAAWVAERYGSRVDVYRGDGHRGMAGNWNAGINRARGHWVHILHDDDMVRPGFYATLRAAIENRPNLGAAFVFHHIIDDDGSVLRPCIVPPRPAGIVQDWVEDVFVSLKIQAPSIVVRRATYEAVGGFDQSYRFFVDWEMWQRIVAHFPIWYDPTPLAVYREHNRSTSVVATFSREGVVEMRRCIEDMRAYLPAAEAEAIIARVKTHYSGLWMRDVWRGLALTGNLPRALGIVVEVHRMSSTVQIAGGVREQIRARWGR